MELRRRMMGKDGSINADSYVQNGLVFQLDGIEWGNVAGHWIERKNGYDWYEGNNVNLHTEDNAMVFDGSNYMITDDTIPSYPYETCSIEICASAIINAEDSIPYINFGEGNVAAFKRIVNNFVCYVPSSGNAVAINKIYLEGKSNISFNGNFYLNATLDSKLSIYAPTLGMRSSSPIIGNAYYYNKTLSTYWLVGKIYSIRIYNRKLSAEEIAFNYNIDKQRFNV
jgi:hypothetical protein